MAEQIRAKAIAPCIAVEGYDFKQQAWRGGVFPIDQAAEAEALQKDIGEASMSFMYDGEKEVIVHWPETKERYMERVASWWGDTKVSGRD